MTKRAKGGSAGETEKPVVRKRARRVRTIGIAPRHPRDTCASTLNEIVLALAAEVASGITVYEVHLAFGNSDLPPYGLGMTLKDQARIGRLENHGTSARNRRYRITDAGRKWLEARGAVARGMNDTIARAAAERKLRFNSGLPESVPIPVMASVSGPTGTTREWLGLPTRVTGEGEWAWANLDPGPMHAAPRLYRSRAVTPEQPGNEMTARIGRALATGKPLAPMYGPEATRLMEACLALSVNAIRRTMGMGTVSQAKVASALTERMRISKPDYPASRLICILRGQTLAGADEAQPIAEELGMHVDEIAPHLKVAPWLRRRLTRVGETDITRNAGLHHGALSEANRRLVERVLIPLGATLEHATLDHLNRLLDGARREGAKRS